MLQDNDDVIRSEIDKEASDSPPSLPYLSAAADHLDCAKWFVFFKAFLRFCISLQGRGSNLVNYKFKKRIELLSGM